VVAAQQLNETRMSRLTAEEKQEFQAFMRGLDDPQATDKDILFSQFGEMFTKTDSYDPCYDHNPAGEEMCVRFDICSSVWPRAAAMKTSGELLRLARQVRCPVVAIHGDYDPTPAEGVEKPLARRLELFKFVVIEKCGHTPWIERHARENFLRTLSDVLRA
jgi:pimeloyl-ACP methyl ester carboxylesterase